MTTPVATLPISFSNEDAKANICAKTQSSINAIATLVKTIVKNSHSNDHLTSTLKQFSNCDGQIVSSQEHLNRIDQLCQQLIFQSDILQLDLQELNEIRQTFVEMNIDQ